MIQSVSLRIFRSGIYIAALASLLPIAALSQMEPQPIVPDEPTPQSNVAIQPTGPTAVLDTTLGRITCKLYDKEAPQAVANFVGLSEGTKSWTNPTTHKLVRGRPLYDGILFHRVIGEFMIQTGDPIGTGEGDPGYYFPDEFNPGLNFDLPGRLAMANSGPNTNGSQFFITEVPTPHLNQKHTIFGQCDDASLVVVRRIARVPRDSMDKPLDPVKLIHISILRGDQPLPPIPAGEQGPSTAPAAVPIVHPTETK